MTDTLKNLEFPSQGSKIWEADTEKNIPPYLLTDEIITILKVAIAIERPLLISGEPGCGKTTLARAMANAQDWNYLKYTLTSRSRLEHLVGDIDQLQRLNDANVQKLNEEWTYLKPGLFWWGFNPDSALNRGRETADIKRVSRASAGANYTSPTKPDSLEVNREGVVILLDEIDKADPDLPNDLLDPLDQRSFQLSDGTKITANEKLKILTMITTNNERDLPPAFLRRCIHLELKRPDEKRLVEIASFHQGKRTDNLYSLLAEKFIVLSNEVPEGERKPGTSEYLDAVQACIKLNIIPDEGNPIWQQIEMATLRKQNRQDND